MNKHQQNEPKTSPLTTDFRPLVEFANQKAKDSDKWFRMMWSQYLWTTGLGLVLSLIIPFGLAFVTLFPSNFSQKEINIMIILLSATSLCCQVAASVLRLKERATTNRQIRNQLQMAIVEFQCGSLTGDELRRRVGAALKTDEEECAP